MYLAHTAANPMHAAHTNHVTQHTRYAHTDSSVTESTHPRANKKAVRGAQERGCECASSGSHVHRAVAVL